MLEAIAWTAVSIALASQVVCNYLGVCERKDLLRRIEFLERKERQRTYKEEK